MLVNAVVAFRWADIGQSVARRILKYLQPRTLEIYKILGILPDIVKLARLAPTVHLYSSPGGSVPLKALDLNEIMEATPQYPYVFCPVSMRALYNHIFID